ncbi:hypothetical protein DAERI_180035 [Deinococcus aerius]|uniref:Uncharacterized protein n=1 Tax=Deinococcus aerius TaxID=200253 RepID=A0A2I9CZZ8_9DEIO|nr:hypothetical protein DAERI_180035 [Deinococcus aerius]
MPVSFVLRNASAVPFHGGTRPCSVNYVVSDARTGALLWTFKTPNQGCKTVLGPKIDLRAGAAGELYRSTLYVQLAGRHGKVGLRPGQYRISGTVEIKGNQEPARTVTTPPVLLTVQ